MAARRTGDYMTSMLVRKTFCALFRAESILLCGLHEVYSHIMLRADLFIYLFIYLVSKSVKLPFATKKLKYFDIFACNKNKTIVTCPYYCKR